MPASVEFRGVSVDPILHEINIRIAPGEAVAFIGRSGAGKSATLAHIMGFLKPDQGRVIVVVSIDDGALV